MSEKYARQVRREISSRTGIIYNTVKKTIIDDVKKQSLSKRIKTAFIYVFTKRLDVIE